MFYLQYISDMYNLNAEITDKYFKFKCQGGKYKNMLVCATVRLLWENIGSITPSNWQKPLTTFLIVFHIITNF